MTEDQRWIVLGTPYPTDDVIARLRKAISQQRAWLRALPGRRRFAGVVGDDRFMIRTTSATKEFMVRGTLQEMEAGTRVLLGVAAMERRAIVRALAVALVTVGGAVAAWFEARVDPDLPETAIGGTLVALGIVAFWVADVSVSSKEMDRIAKRVAGLLDGTVLQPEDSRSADAPG